MKNDGSFQIFFKDGYAWLTVSPHKKGGRPVYPEEVQGKLKLLDIPSVRRQQIYSIIEESSGFPVKLTLWPEGEKLGPDILIDVSEDSMTATLTIKPGKHGGQPLSLEILKKKLKKDGIIFGLREDNLIEAVTRELYNQPVIAATGIFPIHQVPAKPEYYFETDRGKPFKELEYNRIDLKELNFIQNKKKGDLLARILNPIQPADGRDIYGNILPAEKKADSFSLKPGDGTMLSEDGEEIYAAVDGNVKLIGKSVIVEPLITVEDVDYANGNMDFNGTIDIKGRVADGFAIKADGDIQIGKSVSRVQITSGGDMILKAGISGNDEGILICGGDLYARYIENARVLCRGSVYVEEAIMHSRVKADHDIIFTGKRAEIFGGTVVAGGNIHCKKLGNINEPFTELHVGIRIDDYTELVSLEEKVKRSAKELDDLDIKIRQLKNAAGNDEIDKNAVKKISLAVKQLESDSNTLSNEYNNDLKKLHEMKRNIKVSKDAQLKVEQKIFGKVTVYFGTHKWVSSDKGTSKTILRLKQGEIVERGY